MSVPAVPWVLSHPSKGSLLGLARDLQAHLRNEPSVDVEDLGYTLASDPQQLGYRAVLVGHGRDDFLRALEALELGSPAPNLIEGFAERAEDAVFVFPPQGPEWLGMGCELLDSSEAFRRYMRECEDALEPFVDWSLVDVLRGADGAPGLDRGDVAQPAVFAITASIARLLRSYGIEPAAVLGHSLGEIAAAYIAEGLSLEDAARVVALWSQAQETLRGRGGMASVQLGPAELSAYLEPWNQQLNIAAHNGPEVVIVSGDSEPLDELLQELQSRGVRAQRISVPFAAHSPHIDAIRDRLLSDLAPIAPRSGRLPFYSSHTGGMLDTADLDAEYWARVLREVVQFEEATRAVLAEGHRVLLEVSPHPVLTFGMRQTVDSVGDGVVLNSMRREHAGRERISASVGEAWAHGVEVDWKSAFRDGDHHVLELPRSGASVDPEAQESLRERLHTAPSSERTALVLGIVRSQVAAALGYASSDDVSPARPFKELGLDSASVVELAAGLNQLLELRLPPIVGFEHPTCTALAEQVLSQVLGLAPKVARDELPVAVALDEPIAIVGIGCRFPGEVRSAGDLWRFVESGGDAIGGFPNDRGWDLDRLYDPDPDRVGTCYVRAGGFVHDASRFDAEFFGISPREALGMDPQQRMLLEVAWEAFEDAGIDPLSLRGSRTSMFAGVFPQEYGPRLHEADVTAGYSLTGSLTSVASGRIAYTFGFEGAALTIDTACSSSLVALHQACAALRQGECSLALAGGVTVLSTPGLLVEFSRQRGLAMDGRCKSFGAAADGTGFAEGAGLLVLERLSDARRLGHHVLAVVRGSAVNQDGASNGLTAPNGLSQERVIRQALANAGLSESDVDAVEAHGTGTKLGDPIEAQALIATYGQGRSNGPLYLGSLKSNIGHTNAAAGVAGVIKMVQALRHERLPRSLHCDEASPHVDWSAGEVELLRAPVEWPAGERPRRVGVSSFGISGTNAHVILEEAPAVEAPSHEDKLVAKALPFVVSAAGGEALAVQAGRLAAFVEERPEAGLSEVAGALAGRRARLGHRAVVVAGDRGGLVARLRALERDEPSVDVVRDVASDAGGVAFLFSGQGSQWPGMGAELYREFPVFAEALDAVCGELDRYLERPLVEVMFAEGASPEAELLSDTRFTQVALFALEVALYRLVKSFGVRPDYLIGHSVGEFASAHVAGVFSLADGCRLVAERARLMGGLPAGGAMLAVEASEEEALESLAGFEADLALAAVNGPRAVVVSGDAEAIAELERLWRERDRRTTRLRVSHAFHSQLMAPILDEFRAVAAQVELSEPSIPIVSNVTGERLSGERSCSPDYWVHHIRETVRFADGVRYLQQAGVTRFVELGPDAVLSAIAAQVAAGDDERKPMFATSLRGPNTPQREALLAFLAAAHCHGLEIDWSPVLDDRDIGRVELPTYAFQGQRYWLEPARAAGDLPAAGLGAIDHPLLKAAQPLAGTDEWLFTGHLSLTTHPWLADHAAMEVVLLPGTAFVELALATGRRVGAAELDDLTLVAPLVLDARGAAQVQVTVGEADEQDRRPLNIYSRQEDGAGDEPGDGEWTLHASGRLAPGAASGARDEELEAFAAASWPPEDAEEVDLEPFYGRLFEAGYHYGPAFRGLRQAFQAGDAWYGEVALDGEREGEAASFCAHPALTDAALHTMLLAALDGGDPDAPPEVPFSFSGVRLHGQGATSLRVRIEMTDDGGDDARIVSLMARDESGAVVFEIDALEVRPIDQALLKAQASTGQDSLFSIEWEEVAGGSSNGSPVQVALLGGEPGVDVDAARIELARYPDVEALEEMIAAGVPAPQIVLVPAGSAADADGLAGTVHELTGRALALLQAWLGSQPLSDARLVLLTEGALAVSEGESPNLAQSALLGLMRSARSENPGRVRVIDLDSTAASADQLHAALSSEEPELALREGLTYAPRLSPAQVEDRSVREAVDGDGTILITGATGGLGPLLARYLAEQGARRLLLISRSGADADGAEQLLASLAELGCEAEVVACDVADRGQLEALLATIPSEHPLTAVVHAAGVVDDGVIGSLDGERLSTVMAPKVDGAINLHELTRDAGLSEFIMFSSVASILGAPGQGNYAAANAFLDGLARYRRVQGLPATALAWGAWQHAGVMLGGLSEDDRQRWERAGISALPDEQGLELLDAARGAAEPLLVPVRLDTAALRAQAKSGTLPPILGTLIRSPVRAASEGRGSLAARLQAAPESEWQAIVLELVLTHAAAVLGHGSGDAIDPQRAFKDLGFDSLGAVELRNRLSQATGLNLPATLVFDHANPAAVAEFLRSKVAGVERSGTARRGSRSRTDEPIAIVGMSARYPGGVRSPDDLWELVLAGEDAIGEFPDDRGWDLERLFNPDADHPGTSYTRHGGFVYDAAEFDPEFFSISPREALAMDPQQRLLLEGAWEALEDAGIDPSRLRGSPTGVFAGVMYHDYGVGGAVPPDLEGFIGTGGSLISGRLAYHLGLEGPAVSIDTACSSSLVALHLACQALRQEECELALAGGVTVLSTPSAFIQFSRQRALSPDGRCRSFGADANGVGWGEGMGVLVLERLSDAHRSGHRVLALVRGTAVTQDGASNGFTAPNGPSQERVIRQALATHGLSPADVDAVEAHGTGTSLGDPIEAQALLATYGQERQHGPLYLGSVKSNIGHTQAAAGVAGVIKMVEALRHGLLPRSLYCEEPSPHVDWPAGDVELLSAPVDWSPRERARRAGVSSFGISGTNAHVILEEPPPEEGAAEEPGVPLPVVPVLVSARTEAGLRAQAERLRDWLVDRRELSPVDVAFSSATARAQLERRAAVVGGDREGLLEGLAALAAGEPSAALVAGEATGGKTAFLFTGQGAQWAGMGSELEAWFPAFAEALDAVCAELDPHLGRPLKELLFSQEGSPEAELLAQTDVTQAALFAIEVALYRLFESWGVRSDFVIGHSVGELVAAHVAGVLSLEDACALVAARGRLMAALPAGGAMLAVEASEEEAAESLGEDAAVSVAAVNAPHAVVLSGGEQAIAELEALWRERGRKTSRLEVSHAFHSELIEPMLDEFRSLAARLTFHPVQIAVVSNLTGALVSDELRDPDYWVRHARETVRFADGIAELERLGVTRFVELGPDAVLCAMARESLDGETADRAVLAPAMRAGRDQPQTMIACLAAIHAAGGTIDWRGFYAGRGAQRVDLPTHAFQRERYWLMPGTRAGDLSAAGLEAVEHPLLGAALPVAGGRGTSFTGRVSLAQQPWLRDHAVLDRVLFPATAFAELALAAGAELGCGVVEELTLETPLVLADGDEVTLQLLVGDDDGDGQRQIEVFSRAPADVHTNGDGPHWMRHATGVISDDARPIGGAGRRLADGAWPPDAAEPIDVDSIYDRLAEAGFAYGPAFHGAVAAWRRGDEAFCEVALADEVAEGADRFGVHPALLDACFHAMLDRLAEGSNGSGVPLPFALRGVRVHRAGASSLRVALTTTPDRSELSLAAVDESGDPVLELDALAMRPVDAGRLGAAARPGTDSLFRHEWVELGLEEGEGPDQRYAVVGDGVELPVDVPSYRDLDDLVAAIEQGAEAPDVVCVSAPDGPDGDVAAAARAGAAGLLSQLKAWLAVDACAESRLVLVTRGAVAVGRGEAPDPARAALWGLVRSAQSEHPGRFALVDVGEGEDLEAIDVAALLASDEPQQAVRRGRVYGLRLARLHTADALAAPEGVQEWHLAVAHKGTLDGLVLAESSRAGNPPAPDEVRIAVRAGGLNFRDVLIALDQYPDDDPIGSEGAGVVLEVGDAVTDVTVGERVLGLMPEAFGPVAVADHRTLARVPEGWSYAEAASVPVVFMTAYYGLVDIAALREGERVLVQAGAGGVGMAAIQIARHLGAEVYATASPAKWGVLRDLGLDDDHIASSRDLEFRDRFLAATDGEGVDVVLNALAGEFVDASLDLLPRGGRFVELGKADVRDADQVGRDRHGVEYRAIDLLRSAGPARVGEILAAVLELFERGALCHPPIRAWDVRHASEALRYLGDGRNVGKVVLTVPRSLDPGGTVLITGGTGDLGARVARHLAAEHGVKRLLLTSRRGPDAPGAAELTEELRELGAEPSLVACDVSDRAGLSALLGGIDPGHPLTAVIHTAGVLDDGVIESLTGDQVERVMRPKVDAAVLLDELTRNADLAELVLFSSDSGTVGMPGQGNYAAANVFLDALAERRRGHGLPAKSLAWGLWSDATGIAGNLDEGDIARLSRLGVAAMSNELELFDAARARAETVVVPTRLDMPALRAAADAGTLAPLMRGIVRARPRRERDGGRSLEQRLAGVPEHERENALLEFVSEHVAAVLGHGSAQAIEPGRKFKELGADSLAAVELRNRLAQASGRRLPSTLIFDHPSPAALTRYLLRRLSPPAAARGDGNGHASEADVRRLLATIPIERLQDAGLLDPLVRLAATGGDEDESPQPAQPAAVDDLEVDELIRLAKQTN